MSDSDIEVEEDEPITLSAQHLQAEPCLADGVWLLRLTDGETTVEISAEIGDQAVAALSLDVLAMAAGQCAEQVRRDGLARSRRP